jgi:hypothetical protein
MNGMKMNDDAPRAKYLNQGWLEEILAPPDAEFLKRAEMIRRFDPLDYDRWWAAIFVVVGSAVAALLHADWAWYAIICLSVEVWRLRREASVRAGHSHYQEEQIKSLRSVAWSHAEALLGLYDRVFPRK